MWGLGNKKTFVIGVIVLVELVGSHFLCCGGNVVEKVNQLSPLAAGVLSDQRESVRAKREQQSPGEVSGGKGDPDGKNVLDLSSTTLNSVTNGGANQKMNASNTVGPSLGRASTKPKEKTLIIPDRSPPNISILHKEENQSEEEEDSVATKKPGKGDFDEKAVQRAIIVISGIAVIVVGYLGIKFVLIKRRKVVKRYGRVEASEMDLLDEVEDDYESDEEEELFDINQQRRS